MQFRSSTTSPADIASERLVKVTIVTTIFFAFITIPVLLGFFFKPNADEVLAFEYISIVINALQINILMFCLSAGALSSQTFPDVFQSFPKSSGKPTKQ
jgi:hypothetical protein